MTARTTLFEVLLGTHSSVDEALKDASRQIAEVAQRRKPVVRRVVRLDGMSFVKLYDAPEPPAKAV